MMGDCTPLLVDSKQLPGRRLRAGVQQRVPAVGVREEKGQGAKTTTRKERKRQMTSSDKKSAKAHTHKKQTSTSKRVDSLPHFMGAAAYAPQYSKGERAAVCRREKRLQKSSRYLMARREEMSSVRDIFLTALLLHFLLHRFMHIKRILFSAITSVCCTFPGRWRSYLAVASCIKATVMPDPSPRRMAP